MSEEIQRVEEVQGLFGPFQFPELLLQRLWAEQLFDRSHLRTQHGDPLRILRGGRWNRQGGPDFRQAEIRIGERVVHGDVELHLREPDWKAHQHASDPAFDEVVLHVVLFPTPRKYTRGTGGRQIPILILLPHLWHDLEEYAADAAVSAIARRPADRLAEMWRDLGPEACRERIVAEARKRWLGKVRYARVRIEKLGWAGACHQTALEVLGYRFNRVPMLTIAAENPLEIWMAGEVAVESVFEQHRDRWQLSGVRPANHPRKRLHAYERWIKQGGDWPQTLQQLASTWPSTPDHCSPLSDIAEIRRELGLKRWWEEVMQQIGVVDAVNRPRADNLWGDGLLPLVVAEGALAEETGFLWWFGSWPGDQAASLTQAARMAGIAEGRRNPLAWGHVQGLIGYQLATPESTGRGT
ncbi:MAG: hypothetical protein SynsKO_21810 [Synoicihabitans sp.]